MIKKSDCETERNYTTAKIAQNANPDYKISRVDDRGVKIPDQIIGNPADHGWNQAGYILHR